jgi:hypothetical protein
MAVWKPRKRLVNFRLNEEEYQSLRSACAEHGARSISDYAREAVLQTVGARERRERLADRRLLALGRKVSELESYVKNLMLTVNGPDDGGSSNEASS